MKENVLDMGPAARWTPDCQGKWDYDGRLISISTLYWPQGGGYHISDGKGDFRPSIEMYPLVRPSAHSSIHINCGEPDENGFNSPYAHLVEKDFEADTQGEVRAAVEQWVAEQYARIVKCVLVEYEKENLLTE